MGLTRGVVSKRFHDGEVGRPPRRPVARRRHEEDAEAGNGCDGGGREDDEFVLRGRGRAEETDEGQEEAAQADARHEADEGGNDTSEGRLQHEQTQGLVSRRPAGLQDRKFPATLRVAQVDAYRP